MEKPIVFSKHAEYKIALLRNHGFYLSKKEIEEIVRNPIQIRNGYAGRKVAEQIITEEHIFRVIFEDLPQQLKIITMYPARRERYED